MLNKCLFHCAVLNKCISLCCAVAFLGVVRAVLGHFSREAEHCLVGSAAAAAVAAATAAAAVTAPN